MARSERRRRAYSSEEIRERLHARVRQAGGTEDLLAVQDPAGRAVPRTAASRRTRALRALRRRP